MKKIQCEISGGDNQILMSWKFGDGEAHLLLTSLLKKLGLDLEHAVNKGSEIIRIGSNKNQQLMLLVRESLNERLKNWQPNLYGSQICSRSYQEKELQLNVLEKEDERILMLINLLQVIDRSQLNNTSLQIAVRY